MSPEELEADILGDIRQRQQPTQSGHLGYL
jgi:hypothetical protein